MYDAAQVMFQYALPDRGRALLRVSAVVASERGQVRAIYRIHVAFVRGHLMRLGRLEQAETAIARRVGEKSASTTSAWLHLLARKRHGKAPFGSSASRRIWVGYLR